MSRAVSLHWPAPVLTTSTSTARRALLCGGAGLLLPASAWSAAGAQPQRHEARLFGGPVELLLSDTAPDAAAPRAMALLAALHSRWNAWKPGELDELNSALRRGRTLTVSPALSRLLRRAAQMERDSLGCFNPALGALVQAWGFHADVLRDGPAPDAGRLARLCAARPGLDQLRIDGSRVGASSRAVQVDLGGCAKGAALDLALVGFNVGVELGQLAIVLLFLPLAFALRRTAFYRRWVMHGGSLAIAALATVWLVERAFALRLLGV